MTKLHIPDDPNLVEVPVYGLEPGMFVAELDRPWLETPFAMQGFVVQDEADIDYVAKHCSYVYVDPYRKVGSIGLLRRKNSEPVKDKVSVRAEFSRAKVEFQSATVAMEKVFNQIQLNKRVDVEAMHMVISPLIDSVFRNREALAALVRMKNKGEYLFHHSLSTSVWAAVLGRHLGLDRTALEQLALGASIMDVGMAEVPDRVVAKSGPLTPQETAEVQQHVKHSLRIVQASENVSNKVLNLIACHHERHDGSGYPQGLKGAEIPPLARIAALVDSYDAMITERPHARARSSFEAIQELSDQKDQSFQASLVEHFVQTVGMFPTGAVVELNSGEVGVVVEQNPTRRLRPKVVLILNEHKQRLPKLKLIDLAANAEGHGRPPGRWIAAELGVGAHGIKPDDYFL